ncbi:MAG TPA: hypothetical protein VL327_08890 [Pyrinomonadaceae bacterium]|nr:hypothetical protein [Pyrinomonadaceae bacterium]
MMLRLTVRREQLDVMQAVAEANFERQLARHLRESYPQSIVKLPDGGEFAVGDLLEDTLTHLIRIGIAKARRYEMSQQSSIASFVALMFDVAPNFDEHRLCEVLFGDEEKPPDARMEDILTVLTEKNWEAIRNDYDAQAWVPPAEETVETASEAEPSGKKEKANAAAADPMAKTISGKTMSGKTMSRTMARKSQTVKIQPEMPREQPEFDETKKIDRKEQ